MCLTHNVCMSVEVFAASMQWPPCTKQRGNDNKLSSAVCIMKDVNYSNMMTVLIRPWEQPIILILYDYQNLGNKVTPIPS